METIVGALLPPSCREPVMGDLCERYTSPGQYLADAFRTVPFVLWSQIRRSFDVQFNDGPSGGNNMTLSTQEREHLREDELLRLAVREERRRNQRPRLMMVVFLWTLMLTALALVGSHLHG